MNKPTTYPAPWKAEGYKNMVVNAADGATVGVFNPEQAALIAAAPELLHQLRQAVKIMQAAIAKAEQVTP